MSTTSSATVSMRPPTTMGVELDVSPERCGAMRPTAADANADSLRARLEEDGYLFLPGALDRDEVLAARAAVLRRLAAEGALDPAHPVALGVPRSGASGFRPDIAKTTPEVATLLYAGAMMALFARLLAGTVRHFDFTWMRTVARGHGSPVHCDRVYMGRGTQRVRTAWTPLGDLTSEMGGLLVLEGSHRQAQRLAPYLARDVDTYCTNRDDAHLIASGRKTWQFDGTLSTDPRALRDKLGGRWLTNGFRAGDVVIFGMELVHAGTDNHGDPLRLSTDSRYQLAAEEIDERWVGAQPIGHGVAGKRGRVC